MFIEFVDSLRCLTPHEDGWLVAASRRMVGRAIVEGTLGCPICRREYPIVGGVAYFGVAPLEPAPARPRVAPVAEDDEDVMRLAAFLDLATPGGSVVVAGRWGAQGPALAAASGVHCLLLDPPWDGRDTVQEGVSVVRAGGVLPLARGSVRGVALDAATAGDRSLADAVRALAARGRLIAPAAVALPADVTELARDDTLWVAERVTAPSAPVGIGVARRRG